MYSTGSPQKLLLAYDKDFVGYRTLNNMAHSLEVTDSTQDEIEQFTQPEEIDLDGYFSDYTTELAKYISKRSAKKGERNWKVYFSFIVLSFGRWFW